MHPVLEVHQLTKRFGSFTAVDQVSFKVQRGAVFGILGPNGSGKTTTLSMVMSLLSPSEGSVSLFGSSELTTGRKKIGASLETAGFLPRYNADRNLKIAALVKGVPYSDIDRVLTIVDLVNSRKKTYKSYSYGMKQRLAIASALLGDPEVLIFDEPTNGLDPLGIIDIRNLILKLSGEGKTIIVASHLLSEMEKVCSDIVILSKGKLIKEGKLGLFIEEYQTLENAFIKLASTRV